MGVYVGSPPHTRGILCLNHVNWNVLGFTPAYAGNTPRPIAPRGTGRVHPRIRGEYCLSDHLSRHLHGSPPHTRGIPRSRVGLDCINRFTPAYAGNTMKILGHLLISGVHPRIRGEYPSSGTALLAAWGSPPHTRGIHSGTSAQAGCLRFTPAYAGNTGRGDGTAGTGWVHPRIRGEYFSTLNGNL